MADAGLRAIEASRIQFRDVASVDDEAVGERILEIEVRGNRGGGYCESMPGVVRPFERLKARNAERAAGRALADARALKNAEPGAVATNPPPPNRTEPNPTDPIFPKTHRDLFNIILDEEGLKKDRDGRPRTAYSLRHTYICLRLMEGADIYQIAKNCRTSVEMIEKFYAAHIKTNLDAAAINVMKPRHSKAKESERQKPDDGSGHHIDR